MRKRQKPRANTPPTAEQPLPVDGPGANLPPPEVLEALPEHVRLAVIESASFSGPLPPPTMFEGYESVLPGSADRILAMAEKEQQHRTEWEGTTVGSVVAENKRAQWLGFLIAGGCIVGAVLLGLYGDWRVALALCGSAFIVGAIAMQAGNEK